jgi:hypothetical protein
MTGFPRPETVARIKAQYPTGTRVELDQMEDAYNTKLQSGAKGTVTFVDDTGTIFVNWDCGSNLGVVYGADHCHKINE